LVAVPLYAGVAARDPALEALAERTALALGQAFDKRGVVDLGSPPLPDAVDGTNNILAELVAAARNKTLEGDFAIAVQKADEAIKRFEGADAFRVGAAWRGYGDALVVKAVSLRRLGQEAAADASLKRLASIMPAAIPDPDLTPPKIMQRHQQLLEELRAGPRVEIEVQSDPLGADVVVDGESRGQTPIVVRGLLPGAHFVGLSYEGTRVDRVLNVATGIGRVSEPVGDPRAAAARVLRTHVASATGAPALLDAARDLGGDVVVGALLADEDGPFVVLGWMKEGALVVAGARIDKGAPVSARATELVDALLEGRAGWLGAAGPATPELILTRGVPVAGAASDAAPTQPPDDRADDGAPWALIGVSAGIGAVAVVGAIVGVIIAVGNANRVEVIVDASRLN
jgi:hypothetical protein